MNNRVLLLYTNKRPPGACFLLSVTFGDDSLFVYYLRCRLSPIASYDILLHPIAPVPSSPPLFRVAAA